jgi:NAD(P)-dependent dehydrogenase (short-subunit alcohol dehydrogenase family)
MDVSAKIVVVTGGAEGVGRALCERFHRAGAKAVVVADRNVDGAQAVAERIGGHAVACDVAREDDVARLVDETESRFGPIALFCSNAGIAPSGGTRDDAASAPNEVWERGFAVNVMAHVYAARALVPRMAARGGGYFLHTVSAAGLLTQVGNAVYATTKHAAIGFAEILAVTHRDQGIRVSVLCPQGVDTELLRRAPNGPERSDRVLTPEEVAEATLQGIAEERFLILPHPQVLQYMRNKAEDYDRWIGGMAKLHRRFVTGQT